MELALEGGQRREVFPLVLKERRRGDEVGLDDVALNVPEPRCRQLAVGDALNGAAVAKNLQNFFFF